MEAVFYKFETQKIIMTREELIEKLMNVAENYKKGYLHGTGAITDIGVLLDEYTETVVKNCSMPDVSGSAFINKAEQMLREQEALIELRKDEWDTPQEYEAWGVKRGIERIVSLAKRHYR